MGNKLSLCFAAMGALLAYFLVACDDSTSAAQADSVSAVRDTVFIQGGKDTVYVNQKDTVFSRDTVFSKDTVVVRDSVFVNGDKDTVFVVGVDTASRNSGVDYSRKGFMLKGSTVYLYELSDGRTLNQSENVFYEKITRDDGFYKFSVRNLVSQYALLQVEGFYYNVVTGKVSNSPISLDALTDVTMRKYASANVLTELEYSRVYYLVTKEKLEVWTAKRQAQAEILNCFYVDTTGLKGFASAEDLNMFEGTDADNVLLAITTLLLGDRNEAEFRELLTDIRTDIAEDGEWNDSILKKEVVDWAKAADSSGSLEEIQKNIAEGEGVPSLNFAKYIRAFWKAESAK